MAGKLNPVQSAVYKNIRWDFSEVADYLEARRDDNAPDTKRIKYRPLAWVLSAPCFTGLEDGDDGKRPILRAFEACGIMTELDIAEMARYADSTTVSGWDVRKLNPKTIQDRVFPALCDAYCKARARHPNQHSAASTGRGATSYLNDESKAEAFESEIGWTRKLIEQEAIWVLLRGMLDADPSITEEDYILARDGYRRALAVYAAMFLEGGELGDLAHVAAALVAQHVAAHENTDWGKHDTILVSKAQNSLDFTADRYEPDERGVSLHAIVSAEELWRKNEDLTRATLRYTTTRFLEFCERMIRDELDRRSKLGHDYWPLQDAEAKPSDEGEPSA